MLCSSCSIQGIHVSCCVPDTEAAAAFPDNWECDICTIVSQRKQQRCAELMKTPSYREGKVILPAGVYDRVVEQCKNPNYLSINLNKL